MNNIFPYYFKIKKNSSTFLLGIVFLFSCTDSKNEAVFFTADLTDFVVDTLYLEKDTLTKSLPHELVFLEQNGKSFLFGTVGRRMYQYSYPSGKLEGTVDFEIEGPDGIGGFVSGSLITEDGIFFISDQKAIIHTDFHGKVLDRYSLPKVPEERLAVNFSVVNGNRMHYDKEKRQLILADVPFVLKEPNMVYKDWVWKYDLENRLAEPISFSYPEIYNAYYDDPELGVYAHTFLDIGNFHLVSFPVTDSLLVMDGKSTKWIGSKSTTPLIFQKGKVDQDGGYTVFSPSWKTSRYKWVIFEPMSKLILRYIDIETKVSESGKIHNKSSFILHNLDFETIAELFFDNRQIAPSGFATPNGYFFKLLNPDSDDREAYIKVGLNF
ncbi:DUF4221 family protein [Cecembia rubra]|uniref:Uncharacterized protein DUF4221 n=1 Tax=Cecembia rubra TaxID=1485585 RepID=A0A2P8DXU6_9BACT|nr:DUF4221 family protein [Cecembia rubra]PSL02034.1 uncharacterized protein DUF4221 [Cecembia rubra]